MKSNDDDDGLNEYTIVNYASSSGIIFRNGYIVCWKYFKIWNQKLLNSFLTIKGFINIKQQLLIKIVNP